MPISSIVSQPATDDLKAAYRPVVLTVAATATSGGAAPVVYCDIYINDIFYKTQEKTQYDATGNWKFDVQDACQEFLKYYLAANGATSIFDALPVYATVSCRFRSSGFDDDGFITPDGTAPIQGTGNSGPVDGDGTQSNTFFICNSVLQHAQNQNLKAHLGYYKMGAWDANTYPLTHRGKNADSNKPNPKYKVCKGDSDFFPIVYLGSGGPDCLTLYYKNKGDASYSTASECPGSPCTAVSIASFSFAGAVAGTPYSKTVALSGTAPFTKDSYSGPAWLDANISGSSIVYSGTPDSGDVGTGIAVNITISNACGSQSANKTIAVTEDGGCVQVAITGSPTLPNASEGVPYNQTIPITGTTPISIGSITKPAWATVALNVAQDGVDVTGTPDSGDVGTGITIGFTLTNCGASPAVFSQDIDVIALTLVTGIIDFTAHGMFVASLSPTIPCECDLAFEATYDDGGTPTDIAGSVNIGAGNASGSTPDLIGTSTWLCIRPTTSGGSTIVQDILCGGEIYRVTLEIPDGQAC